MSLQPSNAPPNLLEYRAYFLDRWQQHLGTLGGEMARDLDGLIDILTIEGQENTKKVVAEALEMHNVDPEAHPQIRLMIDGS